tara:strand:+ start:14 stop:838 length:825 start_codon:yes stop_codon:yes gene_type:complete
MIIWLASYPKSGNTLVRSILASLIYSKDGNFNFNLLKKIDQYPQKKHFEGLTDKYDNLLELSKFWVFSQDKLNADKKLKFLKTHHLRCGINNYTFTNKNNTTGVIYIVRDPRDVVISYAKHSSYSIEDCSIDMMTSDNCIFTNKNLISLLGSWSDHYNSWTKNNKNLLLIKYEDLLSNKKKETKKIINFINNFTNISISNEKINNCLNTTTFENMQHMEEKGLFTENNIDEKIGKKIKFFNKGKKNEWKNILDYKIRIEIEKKFKNEMSELKYI